MGERNRARQVEEVVVEERTLLALYDAMLKKIDEMSVMALGLESGPETVDVLSKLAMIKVSIEGCIDKAREMERMEEDIRKYEQEKVEGKRDE